MLEWQMDQIPIVTPEGVDEALTELILPREAVALAGLALSSGRSLFVFGPPGNGKTSLGRLLHNAMQGDLWIPYCIGIDGAIIRIFDAQWHTPNPIGGEPPGSIDHRWVRIRRPLIVGGGELTIDAFDMTYSPSLRYYEAPLHLKANGGMFLVDDFGRQRVDPHELLNRWIIPLEHQVDHLTLHTGRSIQVPYRQMLILATNLDPETVMDVAFLRRMGYRLHLDKPTPEDYARIFDRYASRVGTDVEPSVIARLVNRYRTERRELRCCEPRDLIERARDICRFRGSSLVLDEETLDLAWTGYFGNKVILGR
jgi:predicted ATPase with chaperone activity